MRIVTLDVESNGFTGQIFAVGAALMEVDNARVLASIRTRCPIKGEVDPWVAEHVLPALERGYTMLEQRNEVALATHFWCWYRDQLKSGWFDPKRGDMVVVDFGWPLEARFLSMVFQQPDFDRRETPYPLHELGTMLWAAGIDPDTDREEVARWLPYRDPLTGEWLRAMGGKHNPEYDAVLAGVCVAECCHLLPKHYQGEART